MRDPKRILRIVDKIETVWKHLPDMRFNQLLINLGLISDGMHWMTEDDLIEQRLDDMIQNNAWEHTEQCRWVMFGIVKAPKEEWIDEDDPSYSVRCAQCGDWLPYGWFDSEEEWEQFRKDVLGKDYTADSGLPLTEADAAAIRLPGLPPVEPRRFTARGTEPEFPVLREKPPDPTCPGNDMEALDNADR